ncbi:sugar ABC transporter substrate-binding protein [uncultured Metabacillus sp.]|uniref:sugar ABC transporter substrate-binding protein n=1 Tax=uncultured Metabacillus sp. TaxID=2860135 RepID=UPI002613D402|nr:sugar ABC transporter substrate-binding protein [uncultured Metabacillus sp.]
MVKNRKLLFLVTILFSAIIIGFITKSFADEKPKVVVVFKDLNSEYWEILKAGTEKGFKDFGVDGKIMAPLEGTIKEQVAILETVLNEKPDVLVVSPIVPAEIIPTLEKFVNADIPVMLLDTDDPWPQKTAYIGTDNFDLGKKAGELLASQLQPGDHAALIGGDMSSPVSGDRLRGAKKSLEAAGIQIVAQMTELNGSTQNRNAMEKILKDHPTVEGVIASNDTTALDALKVIKEHGRKIPVTGADGITEMLELIVEGTIPGSVAQNPYDMGYLSVGAAVNVSKGEKVEKNIDSGVDILIKENAEERREFLNKILK